MQGRSRSQQQKVVREVLLSMLPPGAPEQKLFQPTKWAAEFNAALTVPFFHWLVGPSEVEEVEINGVKQSSGVHIKKCRYLENNGLQILKIGVMKWCMAKFHRRLKRTQSLNSHVLLIYVPLQIPAPVLVRNYKIERYMLLLYSLPY
ncbi:beta-carotene isomerase D27, chloroplastic-like isoform X1 [Malus sylvestris]|uniref:beta-carotene isomerase D27, chloroplastic-like isoform X1 n=1 Tax=Malus sylvestris TaxID=3752 RepID=UPI0021AC5E87|nr:beta-carotene isomerase D27, chloroplastic-like isoform X1 [Malus sylvestris]